MYLYKKNYSRNELRKKIGDIYQIGGIKKYEYTDGVSKGVRAVDIKNGDGFNATVLLDRGMDLSHLDYKGIPLGWNSPTFETSPVFYESKGIEWLRTFFGGILTTCGLTYAGHPCVDQGEELGLHGRISNLPAYNVNTNEYWVDDNYFIEVSGFVRETSVFGNKLELMRKISMKMGENKLIIEDKVKNIGFEKSPHMIIYHINIGFPILDKNSKLIEPAGAIVTPFDEKSKNEFANYATFDEPVKGFQEQVFFHDIKADKYGNINAAIINEEFEDTGIGVYLKYNKDNLPFLNEWKMIGQGEYVVGIEPLNCNVGGRDKQREEGTLKFLQPDEEVKYVVEIGILKSMEEIKEYKKLIAQI
ncbi:MAG: aldose 1-epimerase family protein [Actinobacteria bacterium]|nr:aldose 1-epimerase family protein [Actinomycetota bacterium]